MLVDRRALWCLAMLALALFGLSNLPWQLDDYDQAKQAFTSFQMVQEGRWLYQTTPHEMVATKPPLVGWFSAALYFVTRSWDFAWRFPSLLAAAAIAILLFRCAKSAYGNVAAVIACAAFAFNLITPRLASLVRTDMPLALIIFAVGTLIWHKIRTSQKWRTNDRLIVFLLLTAGMLIKGPVVWAFLLPGIIAFEFWRAKGNVSAFPGVWPCLASLLIFLLWAGGGIAFVPGFYDQVVVREFLGRFGGEVHRSQPVLFYIPHLLHKLAPWSLLMIAFAVAEMRRAQWKFRHFNMSPDTRWLICWAAGGLVVMSLLPSKRVDRIFPVVPPLCLLLGRQVGVALSRSEMRASVYRWSAAMIAAALLFTSSYFIWKAATGYREHRAALAEFGTRVRQETVAHGWRYAVVSSPDESLLLYLKQTRFLLPQSAAAEWNAGKLDGLVVSDRDAPDLLAQLNPTAVSGLQAAHRKNVGATDYLLLTRPHP